MVAAVAAAAAAAAAAGIGDQEEGEISSVFEWIPGRLEVVDSYACLLHFGVLTAGAAWLSKWDINQTVQSVAKVEPLYAELKIGRCVVDTCSITRGCRLPTLAVSSSLPFNSFTTPTPNTGMAPR